MTQADTVITFGTNRGKSYELTVICNDKIKFVLNELEAEDLLKLDSVQIRGKVNFLTITLFDLGCQVKEFTIYGIFIKTEGVWYKSNRNVQNMILDLISGKI